MHYNPAKRARSWSQAGIGMSELGHEFLQRLSLVVSEVTGLYYPEERLSDLERAFARLAAESNVNAREVAASLVSERLDRSQVERFARHLTVGETYFFREPNSYRALLTEILPELVAKNRARRKLRLWSAGCCTGEEAYSLAMLLFRVIPDIDDWQISILATDINPDFIKRAQEGIYGEWSFRNACIDFAAEKRHFTELNGRYRISDRIKQMVRFDYLNLACDDYPKTMTDTNDMDFIACRNVLIYFCENKMQPVLTRLANSLAPGGYLSLSATEVGKVKPDLLEQKIVQGSYFYTKPVLSAGKNQFALSDLERSLIRAAQLIEQGDYNSAISWLDTVEASIDTTVLARARTLEILELRARALSSLGRLKEALTVVERYIDVDRTRPDGYYFKALVLQEAGNYEAASLALVHCINLDPDFVTAEFLLASYLISQGQLDLARSHMQHLRHNLLKLPKAKALPWSEGTSAGDLLKVVDSLMDIDSEQSHK